MKQTLNLLTVFFFAIALSSCSTDTLDDEQNVVSNKDVVIPEAKTIEIEILELIIMAAKTVIVTTQNKNIFFVDEFIEDSFSI